MDVTHSPSISPSPLKSADPQSIRDNLIEAVTSDPDLPALGSSIARIVQLSSSDDQSIQQLAYFVLSDVSLTQKILRLSNSITYRSASNKANTSITKAIFLLGFNSVQACALAMLLVDGMLGKHAKYVRYELMHALAASMISRELVKLGHYKDAEEIAVAALFKNLGRLLLAAYRHDLYQDMLTLIRQGTHTPMQASMETLGFNIDSLTETVLEKWNIPVSIIQSIKNRPSGNLNIAKNKQEWLQQAAEFSEKAAPLALSGNGSADHALKDKLLERFSKAFNLNRARLDQLIGNAATETHTLLINTNLLDTDRSRKIAADTTHTEFEISTEEHLIDEFIVGDEESDEAQIIQRYPSGKPYNASSLLLTGIQDVTEILGAGNYKLESLIMLILETYYNSLGFRFIALVLRDSKMNCYRARGALGKNSMEYQQAINFPTSVTMDLFHLSLQKNVDLLISDAQTPKIGKLIPEWHKKMFSEAQSFMVLPLIKNNKPLGFFYADRETQSPEGITSEETRLIKTLKGQLLTAFNSN